MNFKFHHMNICTDNLPRLTKFYRTLFDLGTIADKEHTVVSGIREDRAYTGKVDFLTDGDIEHQRHYSASCFSAASSSRSTARI